MSLATLADLVLREPALAASMRDARSGLATLDLTGPAALRPFVVKGLVDAGRTVLVVAATVREAEDLTEELQDLMDPASVALYPAWETLPHERLSPRSDTVGRRLAVLRRIKHPGTEANNGPLKVIVAPVRSVLQPQVKGLADLEPVELAPGQEVELEDVVRRLAGAAYSRVDLVEKRGEFAVRGGIVDVFPPTEEHPVRVEFFGDEIDEIRAFAVADQRTLEPVERLWAPPCRELLLTDDVRRRAAELGEQHPQLAELTDKLAQGMAVEGMESLSPALVDEMEMLVDLLPPETHVLVLDPERVRTRAHDLVATSDEFLGASWAAAASGGTAPIDLGAASLRGIGEVRTQVLEQGQGWWGISPFGIETDQTLAEIDPGAAESRAIAAQPADAYRGDIEAVITDIRAHLAGGRSVVTIHQGHGPAQRMVEVLGEHDVPARLVETVGATEATDGLVLVTQGCLA
ncbi:MAG: transcription-repair coupling factor, partial [Marmoricola sp.]